MTMGSPLLSLLLVSILPFLIWSEPNPTPPPPEHKYLLHPSLLSIKPKDPKGSKDAPLNSDPLHPEHTTEEILKRFRRAPVDPEEEKTKRLKIIIPKLDAALFTLHEHIEHHAKFGQPCTRAVPVDSENLHKELYNTTDWLGQLEETRYNFARGLYHEHQEGAIIYNLVASLRNSIQYAKDKEAKNKKITLCDQFLYLDCGEENTCECFSNERGEIENFPKNNHYSGPMMNTSFYSKIKLMKDKKQINQGNEGLCMINKGSHCPVMPSLLMCQPGTTCLTILDKRLCTLENLGLSFAIMMKNDTKYTLQLKRFDKPSSISRIGPSAPKPRDQIHQSYLMTHFREFSKLCQCFDYGFCQDFKEECAANKGNRSGEKDNFDYIQEEADYANVIKASVLITFSMFVISAHF